MGKTSKELRAEADELEKQEELFESIKISLPKNTRKFYKEEEFKIYCDVCENYVVNDRDYKYNYNKHKNGCVIKEIEPILEMCNDLCDAIVNPGPDKVILVKTALQLQDMLENFNKSND